MYAGFQTTYSEADLDRVRELRRETVQAREAMLALKSDPTIAKWAKADAADHMRQLRGCQAVLDYLEGATPSCIVAAEIAPYVGRARAFLEGRP